MCIPGSFAILSEKSILKILGKEFNFQIQISIKLFLNAGLISFDHPVIKQTSNEQFF